MLNDTIKTAEEMRYDTVGDWPEHGQIVVADMGNEKYEWLVGLHEYIESFLCKCRGITPQQIDDFDLNWNGDTEPGDQMDAPYHKEHAFATKVERMACEELGIEWEQYGQFLNNFIVKIKE